jgi:hypothetical protein
MCDHAARCSERAGLAVCGPRITLFKKSRARLRLASDEKSNVSPDSGKATVPAGGRCAGFTRFIETLSLLNPKNPGKSSKKTKGRKASRWHHINLGGTKPPHSRQICPITGLILPSSF